MNEPRRGVGPVLARYYDLDMSDGEPDVEMYSALATAAGQTVLELGCGSGRISVPLAAAGLDVTGVDNDPAMLNRAREAWAGHRGRSGVGALRLIDADMTSLDLPERFDLVILAFSGLLLLPDRAGQLRALEVLAAHVAADGRAVIDVWLPGPDDLALYDGRLLLDWVRRDNEAGEWVAKTTSATYAPGAAVAEITSFFEAWRDDHAPRRVHRRDVVNFIGRTELLALLERAGLQPQIVAGDYEMNALEPNADRVIAVCHLKPPTGGGPSVPRLNSSGAI